MMNHEGTKPRRKRRLQNDALDAVLDQLDAAIRKDNVTVPENNRKLLTYHDSWAYWAREYGWQVIGAIQPSDFKEPSAREVADLITQIKDEGVPAIFGSEVFPFGAIKFQIVTFVSGCLVVMSVSSSSVGDITRS